MAGALPPPSPKTLRHASWRQGFADAYRGTT
jgi:hypothetical protein